MPNPEEIATLQKKLVAANAEYAESEAKKPQSPDEKAKLKANIDDIKAALEIAQGKHGTDWGSKPYIKGRMEQ